MGTVYLSQMPTWFLHVVLDSVKSTTIPIYATIVNQVQINSKWFWEKKEKKVEIVILIKEEAVKHASHRFKQMIPDYQIRVQDLHLSIVVKISTNHPHPNLIDLILD